jgi:outer membrane protein
MRKFALAFAALASLCGTAMAAEGPLMVRLRGVYILPADKSDAVPALGITAKDQITVSAKFIPEVDFSYFFTPNISAELILTYPQEHDVKITGIGKIGTVTHLPPVLSAQYHFIPGGVVNPYVGLGVNLTLITAQKLHAGADLKISDSSVGVSGQVGADFKVADQIYVNVDVKYVTMGYDVKVKASGTKVSAVDVSPWLLGAGVGYRF